MQKLFEILEKVSEIRDTKVDRVKNTSKSLENLQTQLNAAVVKCDTIINNQANYNSVWFEFFSIFILSVMC